MLIGLGVLALLALLIATKSFKIVGQAEVMVIERLGRVQSPRALRASTFSSRSSSARDDRRPLLREPMSTGVKQITSGSTARIDLREQVLNFPSQPVITKDNVTIDIDAVLYYRVADPQKATYSVQNLPYALETLTRTTLRNIVGEMELDQTLASRDVINKRMREVIEEASIGWGVDVTRVELQAIEPPRDIQQSMELQNARRARAARGGDQRRSRQARGDPRVRGRARVAGATGRGREGRGGPARAGSRRSATRDGQRRGGSDPADRERAPRGPGRDVPARPEVPRGAARRSRRARARRSSFPPKPRA